MTAPRFVPLTEATGWRERSPEEMRRRATEFREEMARRRTVRTFSDRPLPPGIVEECLRAAVSAPSGANLAPWHFAVVSDPGLKRRIREGAEAEEREFYGRRATREWLAALAALGTDERKPFLETAPVLIAIFACAWGTGPDGGKVKHYYVAESVGIATGFLIAALHHAGVATLTHTPSPMGFLNGILGRPANEKPYLLLVAGYPAEDARVPVISRRPFEEAVTFL